MALQCYARLVERLDSTSGVVEPENEIGLHKVKRIAEKKEKLQRNT